MDTAGLAISIRDLNVAEKLLVYGADGTHVGASRLGL